MNGKGYMGGYSDYPSERRKSRGKGIWIISMNGKRVRVWLHSHKPPFRLLFYAFFFQYRALAEHSSESVRTYQLHGHQSFRASISSSDVSQDNGESE